VSLVPQWDWAQAAGNSTERQNLEFEKKVPVHDELGEGCRMVSTVTKGNGKKHIFARLADH
jgi:hypothetical protein